MRQIARKYTDKAIVILLAYCIGFYGIKYFVLAVDTDKIDANQTVSAVAPEKTIDTQTVESHRKAKAKDQAAKESATKPNPKENPKTLVQSRSQRTVPKLTVNKCTDANGNITFQDSECSSEEQKEEFVLRQFEVNRRTIASSRRRARKLQLPTPSDLILATPVDGHLSYAELFSSVGDLESALRKLRPASNEVELVRLLSIISSVGGAWSNLTYGYRPALEIISNLLVEQWASYPDIISANKCIYCGNYFRFLIGLVNLRGSDETWRSRVTKTHPRFMQLADTSSSLSAETRIGLAKQYAQLVKAGDMSIAKYIGHILLENEHFSEFSYWAQGGINGSYAVSSIKDFTALPRENLYSIWEAGMRNGFVNSTLTIHLLATGYRPALRYVIWQMDGAATYLKSHVYDYSDLYRDVMLRHCSFPFRKGPELSRFYSDNWRQIHWDESSQRWQL